MAQRGTSALQQVMLPASSFQLPASSFQRQAGKWLSDFQDRRE
jgi:hypothetical protein